MYYRIHFHPYRAIHRRAQRTLSRYIQSHLFLSTFAAPNAKYDACFQLVELVVGGGARFADVDVS